MPFIEILNDKNSKPKEKTEALSNWVLKNPGKLDGFINFAGTAKDPVKATCIEALEFATKTKPEIATPACMGFVTKSLDEKAPRIKWESARVITNIVHLYPNEMDNIVLNLLNNTQHSGTVVRWSAAQALAQIIKLKTSMNKELIPVIESICAQEEKNSIKKIYLDALKKTK